MDIAFINTIRLVNELIAHNTKYFSHPYSIGLCELLHSKDAHLI